MSTEIHMGLQKKREQFNFLNYQNISKSKRLFDVLLEKRMASSKHVGRERERERERER